MALLASFDAAQTPNKYYYHFDNLGSTVLVTNGSGTVSDSFLIAPEYAERSESPVSSLRSAVCCLQSPVSGLSLEFQSKYPRVIQTEPQGDGGSVFETEVILPFPRDRRPMLIADDWSRVLECATGDRVAV